jgi:hypothetical protein
MANIGTMDFYIGVPSLPRKEFEDYSTKLFDEWEAYVGNNLELQDYSLVLEVEEGSIKAKGKIIATLGVIYFGIGQYGSFISGLQTIQSQIQSVGDYLGERAGSPFESSSAKPRLRKRGESLARLHNLFVKVQRGDITIDMAMMETEVIFGSELEDVPEFLNDLKDSLERTPLLPKQMPLPLVDSDGEDLMQESNTQKKPTPRKPRPPAPILDQYRVEVWRENKQSKRNVKIISL